MRKKNYLPKGDKEREAWLNTFAAKFEIAALDLGFTAAEISSVINFAAAYSYVLRAMNIMKTEEKEWTSYKDLLANGEIGSHLGPFPVLPTLPIAPILVPAGIFKSISMVVQRVKNHPNYDESIGRNLGIIGPENTINMDDAKVAVTLRRSDNDGVALDFVKDVFDVVIIYSGKIETKSSVPAGAEAIEEEPVMTWEEIGRVAVSPYVDTRVNETNKPETRFYKMRYMVKEMPVGKFSDTITVISTVGADLANKLK